MKALIRLAYIPERPAGIFSKKREAFWQAYFNVGISCWQEVHAPTRYEAIAMAVQRIRGVRLDGRVEYVEEEIV